MAHNCWLVDFRSRQVPSVTYSWSDTSYQLWRTNTADTPTSCEVALAALLVSALGAAPLPLAAAAAARPRIEWWCRRGCLLRDLPMTADYHPWLLQVTQRWCVRRVRADHLRWRPHDLP